jgi:hypothetical protein
MDRPVAASSSAAALSWTAPDGWREEAGSGMRLATFTIDREGSSATCTIVTLGGAAGGLEANVRRWMGQLKIADLPPDEFSAFLEKQERVKSEGGFDMVLVDLTELGDAAPDSASMLAAIVTVPNTTAFVKFTGPTVLLKNEKESFTKLCRSLRSSS